MISPDNNPNPKWKRIQQSHEQKELEKQGRVYREICFVQRVGESKKTSGLIVLRAPGRSKMTGWRAISNYLKSGVWC